MDQKPIEVYCIKHMELMTPDLNGDLSCAFCEWGDPPCISYDGPMGIFEGLDYESRTID